MNTIIICCDEVVKTPRKILMRVNANLRVNLKTVKVVKTVWT